MASRASKRAKPSALQAFINATNDDYNQLHHDYEQQFWGTKMNLSVGTYSKELLTSTKLAMEAILADKARLDTTREWMKSGEASPEQLKCLHIFERTFLCYIMESEEAAALRTSTMGAEGELEARRSTMSLGYNHEGLFTEMSSVGLRNTMKTNPEEAKRQAAYAGLRSIGPFIANNGFVEIVKSRNAMAKKLGFECYYDYKVQGAEGFGKKRLFEILDTLEEGSRGQMEEARTALAKEKGEAALQPWNTSFMTSGDVASKLDPYFPFDKAVERWGRSFARLGVQYRGATMKLDLLDRKQKYSNGFCHWPQCAWRRPDGSWQPSVAHFTSLADPKAVGSGMTALVTLMHEAGHAAHFANIDQPSPLFSQERAPTSVAYAENQSMFLDSLVGDAAWRARYCKNAAGEVLPWEIHEEHVRATHPYDVFMLRSMLAVPYFEKALYELPEEEVTPERILQLADEIELKIQGGAASRPLLSVPHILSDESACYYHGYVLAEMSVHQTRAFFLSKHRHIVDNPAVGAALTKAYWLPGNSEPFLELVKNLTGAPLTGEAWIKRLRTPLETMVSGEKKDYEEVLATSTPDDTEVDLKMHVQIVDGDELIADSAREGGFLPMCKTFSDYIQDRFY